MLPKLIIKKIIEKKKHALGRLFTGNISVKGFELFFYNRIYYLNPLIIPLYDSKAALIKILEGAGDFYFINNLNIESIIISIVYY